MMDETWICFYCKHENSESATSCDGDCGLPREFSNIRQEFSKRFPDELQYYSLEDARKRLAEIAR